LHAIEIREAALALTRTGLNDCEVARRLGVPRSTVRDWRAPPYVRRHAARPCPRCWRELRHDIRFSDVDYSELLGLYLGDGYIARTGRSDRLRLYLDSRYPRIVAESQALLERCFPGRSVGCMPSKHRRMTILSLYCTHLRCVLPQHGEGRKHERPIVLESWQRERIEREPWSFLRGCIRSDGCAFINRTGRYAYLSYEFKNRSVDILRLFRDACEMVGVEYRGYAGHVRIYRRASVDLMLHQVGLKE
jgi:Homeodomain-like domain